MRADSSLSILALAALALAGLALAGLGPTAARAAGFDCKKATTHVERLICADPALSDLDSELKRVFDLIEGETFGHNAEPPYQTIDPVGREETRWLRTVRNKCVDQRCLKQAYVNRIANLRARWAEALPDSEWTASLAGIYVRKQTGNAVTTGDGGGSFEVKPQGPAWRITADIGGIPNGAATHPDCKFEAQGVVSSQAFKGTLLPDEDGRPAEKAKPSPGFAFTIIGSGIAVHGADSMVLCQDDRVIVDGVYVKTTR
jgi:uncharacterized protein